MAGTRGGHNLMLGRIACLNRQGIEPIFPVAVVEQNRDGRTNGSAMADAGENMGCIALDLHAAAAAKALLPPPKFVVHNLLIDLDTRRKAGQKRYKRFSVRFTGSKVTQHNRDKGKTLIVIEAAKMKNAAYQGELSRCFSIKR